MSIHNELYWPAAQNLARYIVGAVLHGSFSITYHGLENIPNEGPTIIAANHIRATDSFIIGLAINQLHFGMGKEEYYFWPGAKQVLTWIGAFPVARPDKYLEKAKKYSKATLDKYLLAPNQFNYEEYVPKHLHAAFLEDIKKTLSKHDIKSIAKIPSLVLAQYFLMKKETMLIHAPGTRNHDGKCKTGIARIKNELKEMYDIDVVIVPSIIAYEDPLRFRSKVHVRFGSPLITEGDVETITCSLEQQLNELYAQTKKRI